MRAGVIVAGGRSTRFGEADKAVADLAGTPMVRHVADRLAGVVDLLVVNCRRDQVADVEAALSGYERPVRVAVDENPDEGPMAGIRTGLRTVLDEWRERGDADTGGWGGVAESPYAFVAACDMPFVDPPLVDYLFDRATGSANAEEGDGGAVGHDAAVPKLDDGWFQPTHAVYRADAMVEACEAALDRGERRVIAPLDELDYVVVDEAAVRERTTLDTFENLNTREEFERAARRFEADGGPA